MVCIFFWGSLTPKTPLYTLTPYTPNYELFPIGQRDNNDGAGIYTKYIVFEHIKVKVFCLMNYKKKYDARGPTITGLHHIFRLHVTYIILYIIRVFNAIYCI